jgi:hypothetical protein
MCHTLFPSSSLLLLLLLPFLPFTHQHSKIYSMEKKKKLLMMMTMLRTPCHRFASYGANGGSSSN